MNELKTLALEKFSSAYESELKNFELAYLKSRDAYEKAMKKFIIKHITTNANFDERKREAWLETVGCGSVKDWVSDRDVYETMIGNEQWWLEEGQFDFEDEA